MKQAIKKSIEGGWRNHSVKQAQLIFDGLENAEVFVNGFGYAFLHRKGEEAEGGVFSIKSDSFRKEEALLDPLFWQSLCKSLGFTGEPIRMCVGCGVALKNSEQPTMDGKHGGKNGCGSDIYNYDGQWLVEWHRFVDHLAEGKDAESFFEGLLLASR